MPPFTKNIFAIPIASEAFDGAEISLERLAFPDDALLNLAHISKCNENMFRHDTGWAAQVTLEGTTVLIRTNENYWEIYAPRGADESEVMFTARKLHGLLGEKGADWDLDR